MITIWTSCEQKRDSCSSKEYLTSRIYLPDIEIILLIIDFGKIKYSNYKTKIKNLEDKCFYRICILWIKWIHIHVHTPNPFWKYVLLIAEGLLTTYFWKFLLICSLITCCILIDEHIITTTYYHFKLKQLCNCLH